MMNPEVTQREETVTTVDAQGVPQRVARQTTVSEGPAGYRARSLVWLAAGVVEILLAVDFIFKLSAANGVGFVAFISDVAGALSSPFRGIFNVSVAAPAHLVYWPDVVAMVVYLVAAWIVVALVGILSAPRSSSTLS